jgi:probable HAF family extracellular repeat protein
MNAYAPLLACVLAFASSMACANHYEIVDLGERMVPTRINDQGEVSAYRSSEGVFGETGRAMAYRDGRWITLRGKRECRFEKGSLALFVNNAGIVAGSLCADSYPVTWAPGQHAADVALPPDAYIPYVSWAAAISDEDTIVGAYSAYRDSEIVQDCFRTTADGISIGLQSDSCSARGVNTSGVIVGKIDLGLNEGPAFVWADGNFTEIDGTQYGYGWDTEANAINDAGQVVGGMTDKVDCCNYITSAFVWVDGIVTRIYASPDYRENAATAVNERGEIVGYGLSSVDGESHALRYSGDHIVELESEVARLHTWRLESAESVNGQGVIVGTGRLGGKKHGFMLVPKNQ